MCMCICVKAWLWFHCSFNLCFTIANMGKSFLMFICINISSLLEYLFKCFVHSLLSSLFPYIDFWEFIHLTIKAKTFIEHCQRKLMDLQKYTWETRPRSYIAAREIILDTPKWENNLNLIMIQLFTLKCCMV